MSPQHPYEFDDDPNRIDLDAVRTLLSIEAYWSRRREFDYLRGRVRRTVAVGSAGGLVHEMIDNGPGRDFRRMLHTEDGTAVPALGRWL